MRIRLSIVVLLCAAAASAALADRETAEFSASRGDKALAARKFDEAESMYRRALDDDDTYLPARYGLAQALVGAGKSGPAVEELRRFVADARACAALPAEWKGSVAKAERQLADLDAAGTALRKIQSAYVEALVDLAQRWSSKDPILAERALRRALETRPDHPKAAELLAKLGRSAKGRVVDLFDGTSFEDWHLAVAPEWEVRDGEIVGTIQNATKYVWSTRTFEGDHDVRVEARLLEENTGTPFFALFAAFKSEYDHYTLGRIGGKLWWSESVAEGKPRDVAIVLPTQLRKPYDPKQWNSYEIQFRGDEVKALVNGDEIGKETRPQNRKGGSVGLVVQSAKVAFRKIQVELR
jgi:tetratricopeptide (TPR) repeat protein